MNERIIKELLVQARVYDCEPTDPDFKLSDVGDEYLKLIELIVRECATLAFDGPNGILDHFGVEE